MPEDLDRKLPASAEIEFALVLSRMIDSVKNDPTDLRQAIYELARYKLREQFSHTDAHDIQRSQQALEAAIRGVEDFSMRQPAARISAPVPDNGVAADGAPRLLEAPEDVSRSIPILELAPAAKGLSKGFAWRVLALLAVLLIVVLVVQQRDRFWPARKAPPPPALALPVTPAVPAPQPTPSVKPARLLPTDYGVYAVSNGTLVNLEQLLGRPSDMRVAISAAITAPPSAVLPDGRVKFIVFRRDLGSSSSDRADIRIIAKIAKDFSPDVAKPGAIQDVWVMRNIAFPLRAAPIPDNPDMYELRPDDTQAELPPGRYALALKNNSFDFSVAGKSVDPRHCLERVVSTTGTFYSPCGKP